MNASELREKSVDELGNDLLDLRREQFNLRMQKAAGTLPQTDQMRKLRRDIARVKTVLTELRQTENKS